jgi:hypothetical protein
MARQEVENLFRRFKGEVVDVKTISGGIYSGRVVEISNDYVCLTETSGAAGEKVFLFFAAIESMAVSVSDTD